MRLHDHRFQSPQGCQPFINDLRRGNPNGTMSLESLQQPLPGYRCSDPALTAFLRPELDRPAPHQRKIPVNREFISMQVDLDNLIPRHWGIQDRNPLTVDRGLEETLAAKHS